MLKPVLNFISTFTVRCIFSQFNNERGCLAVEIDISYKCQNHRELEYTFSLLLLLILLKKKTVNTASTKCHVNIWQSCSYVRADRSR
jgi:hypothetical protein